MRVTGLSPTEPVDRHVLIVATPAIKITPGLVPDRGDIRIEPWTCRRRTEILWTDPEEEPYGRPALADYNGDTTINVDPANLGGGDLSQMKQAQDNVVQILNGLNDTFNGLKLGWVEQPRKRQTTGTSDGRPT